MPITPGQSDYLKTISAGEVNYETWSGVFYLDIYFGPVGVASFINLWTGTKGRCY